MNLPIIPAAPIWRAIKRGSLDRAIRKTRAIYGVSEIEAATYVGLYLL